MSSEPPLALQVETSRFKRVCMRVTALLIVYGNLAVTFDPGRVGLPELPSLPRPFAVQDAFLIAGMFSGYTTFNFDFFVEGQAVAPVGTATSRPFTALDVEEFFPLRAPITYTQVFAAHHRDMLGASAQRGVWALYARQIKARHNRLHPKSPISGLRFGVVTFPQSVSGYRGNKRTESTMRYLWYADP